MWFRNRVGRRLAGILHEVYRWLGVGGAVVDRRERRVVARSEKPVAALNEKQLGCRARPIESKVPLSPSTLLSFVGRSKV